MQIAFQAPNAHASSGAPKSREENEESDSKGIAYGHEDTTAASL